MPALFPAQAVAGQGVDPRLVDRLLVTDLVQLVEQPLGYGAGSSEAEEGGGRTAVQVAGDQAGGVELDPAVEAFGMIDGLADAQLITAGGDADGETLVSPTVRRPAGRTAAS